MRQFHDRIGETSTTTGTDPFVLAGAIGGHRTFGSVSADGEKRVYHADDENGNWEVGLGTYNEAANTFRALTNADVWASSNGGNLVDFPSGTKHVVHGQSAEEVPFVRNPGDPRWQVPEVAGDTGQALIKSGDQQLGWGTFGGDLDDAVILAPETSDRNVITPSAVDVVPLTVNGLPSQTADLQRWGLAGQTRLSAAGNLALNTPAEFSTTERFESANTDFIRQRWTVANGTNSPRPVWVMRKSRGTLESPSWTWANQFTGEILVQAMNRVNAGYRDACRIRFHTPTNSNNSDTPFMPGDILFECGSATGNSMLQAARFGPGNQVLFGDGEPPSGTPSVVHFARPGSNTVVAGFKNDTDDISVGLRSTGFEVHVARFMHNDNLRLHVSDAHTRIYRGGGTQTVHLGTTIVLDLDVIPATNPGVPGQLYRDGTDLRISTG